MSILNHKQARKIAFYTKGFLRHFLVPNSLARKNLPLKLSLLNQLSPRERSEIEERVAYYHKLDSPFVIPESACPFAEIPRNKTTYFLDFTNLLRHFPAASRTALRFGDVTDVSNFPRFVKTRPLEIPHDNSVLLRLNSIRHFQPITDPKPFREKKDALVWRGKAKKDHRLAIFQKHFDHPRCDLGNVLPPTNDETKAWHKPFMSVRDQLDYKFILSIEGNEVATNLKWISQSNSLCFMKRPRFESWFMEGTLKAGVHYVELQSDYSDLPEKIDHYLAHPGEAEEIIANFREYHRRFANPVIEELTGLLVVQKYLRLSGQLSD